LSWFLLHSYAIKLKSQIDNRQKDWGLRRDHQVSKNPPSKKVALKMPLKGA